MGGVGEVSEAELQRLTLTDPIISLLWRLGYRLVVHPQRGTLRVCLKNCINILLNPQYASPSRMMERVAGRSDRMSERTTERNPHSKRRVMFKFRLH